MILTKRKMRFISGALFILIIISCMSTNPSKQEYLQFIDWSEPTKNTHVQIERVNFFIFSTYTPIVAHEAGTTHLGIFGHFFRISDGQFDYPWWLEFF
ncbi:MAG: hypothetical protein R3267_09240 [Paenisporosarcina sp.]|nr:hypothetical protein [Paenisporosarcina sp.]